MWYPVLPVQMVVCRPATHTMLPWSVDDGGMFYFEVEDNRLDAKFIRRTGVISDQFTIMKNVNRVQIF